MPSPTDPDVHPATARGLQIHTALLTLNYPQATEDAPGWLLQLANTCTCDNHPRAAETAFAIFWVYLPALESVEPPECDRAGSDRALTSIALDLQLLGFPAVAQGLNMSHGGLVAVLVNP